MGNLLTEVALLASYQPAGLYCRMVSALQHLDQVQSLCSPCCADKSEQSSHHNYISLLHSDLLLPFLALHKDAATQSTGPEYVDEAACKGGPLKQIYIQKLLFKN